jgi:hypothetical protein
MFVSVTFPQLVTTPLIVCGWPTTAVVHVLVTAMHGASVTTHTFVAEAVTRVPQMLLAEAVTMFVFPPHTAVMTLL